MTNTALRADAARRGEETILVLERDVLTRVFLSDYLRSCGYRVLEARSAAEALTILQESLEPISCRARRCGEWFQVIRLGQSESAENQSHSRGKCRAGIAGLRRPLRGRSAWQAPLRSAIVGSTHQIASGNSRRLSLGCALTATADAARAIAPDIHAPRLPPPKLSPASCRGCRYGLRHRVADQSGR